MTDEQLSEEGTGCDVKTLGEQVEELANAEVVTFFYCYKTDDHTIFFECCRKEKVKKEISSAEQRGFSIKSPPSPDFFLRTINGRAEINVSVVGELNLLGGNDVTLRFERHLDTARHSDILVGTSNSSKQVGYVRISVPPAYTAQHLAPNTDGLVAVLPITIIQNDQVVSIS